MNDEPLDITGGIPSEIHVGIGRGRYVDYPYELAREVAEAVRAERQAEVERLREELRIARGDFTAAERYAQDFIDGTADRRQDNA